MTPEDYIATPLFSHLVLQVLEHPCSVRESSDALLQLQQQLDLLQNALALRALQEVVQQVGSQEGVGAILLKIDALGNQEKFLVIESCFGFVNPAGCSYWIAKPLGKDQRLILNRLLNPLAPNLLLLSQSFEAPAQIAHHIQQLQQDEYPACGYLWVSATSLKKLESLVLKPHEQSAIEHVLLEHHIQKAMRSEVLEGSDESSKGSSVKRDKKIL